MDVVRFDITSFRTTFVHFFYLKRINGTVYGLPLYTMVFIFYIYFYWSAIYYVIVMLLHGQHCFFKIIIIFVYFSK